MPRPIQCWYIEPRDVAKYCDLTSNSVVALHSAGQVTDDLQSLFVFAATHLRVSARKSLKQALAAGKFHGTKEESVGEWETEREQIGLHWIVNSKTITAALGITVNSWHIGYSRRAVDPSDLLSLLRFACLYARPDIKAKIAGAVFSKE